MCNIESTLNSVNRKNSFLTIKSCASTEASATARRQRRRLIHLKRIGRFSSFMGSHSRQSGKIVVQLCGRQSESQRLPRSRNTLHCFRMFRSIINFFFFSNKTLLGVVADYNTEALLFLRIFFSYCTKCWGQCIANK